MTLDELRQLQALLEKAQQHAERQAAYTPNTNIAVIWDELSRQCMPVLINIGVVIDMIEEAMHDEQ